MHVLLKSSKVVPCTATFMTILGQVDLIIQTSAMGTTAVPPSIPILCLIRTFHSPFIKSTSLSWEHHLCQSSVVHLLSLQVCRDIGLEVNNIVLGTEVESMTDAKLKNIVQNTTVFAKVSPVHKCRIVKVCR